MVGITCPLDSVLNLSNQQPTPSESCLTTSQKSSAPVPSSPVAGTNNLALKSAPDVAAPVAAPVADVGTLAAALGEIGKALIAVSHALGNGTPGSLVPNPPQIISAPFPVHDSPTIATLINDFLVTKCRAGKSDRYLRAMKNSLSKFSRGRSTTPAQQICFADVERWITKNDWNGTTRHGYLRDLRTLFNWAVRRGLVNHNPAKAVELPEKAPQEIKLHTPAQVAIVLVAARGHDLNIMRALAIRYFAGLRSSECDRLTEADIFSDRGFIQITKANARKTKARRLVKIEPVLAAWLKQGGEIPLHDVGNRLRAFNARLKDIGVPWPYNVTRHSFVSYHLAHFQEPGKTALQAGHTVETMFRDYRELVTAEDAAEFWRLTPERCTELSKDKASSPAS